MRINAFGALAFVHRWLGIAGWVLFMAWFASGIVMIYARMPEIGAGERRARTPVLDLSRATISAGEAAQRAGLKPPSSVVITMLGPRPVYRFSGSTVTTVFADTGESLAATTPDDALALAKSFAPEHAQTLTYDALLTEPDQWTLQSRTHLPIHRLALGDPERSALYISGQTGEPVMKTTARTRFWAYLGPVTHWIYFPVLRRNGPLWTQVIIWASLIGCVVCISGITAGLIRVSPFARYRVRGEPSMSPYTGLLRWHHYAGLLFGAVTLTWAFSGYLSMGPFSWLSNQGLTREQRQVVTGGPARAGDLPLATIREAIAALGPSFQTRELSLIQFRGEPYWIASSADTRQLVPARHPERGAFARFSEQDMREVARALMPGIALLEAAWLEQYDAYYYDRRAERPLPVLRVRYADPDQTWVYLDPHRGGIALVSGRLDRLNRWLYHGLHSLDFPLLYNRRPAWDVVVIALSLGGIALGATSLVPGWRRLRRASRRA